MYGRAMARPHKYSLSKFHCNKIPFPNHNIPSNIGTMYTSSHTKKIPIIIKTYQKSHTLYGRAMARPHKIAIY